MIGNMDQFINKGCGNDSYKGGSTTRHIASGVTQTITPPQNQRVVIFYLVYQDSYGTLKWHLKSGGEFIYQVGSKKLSQNSFGFCISERGNISTDSHSRVKFGLNKDVEIYNGDTKGMIASYYFEGRS